MVHDRLYFAEVKEELIKLGYKLHNISLQMTLKDKALKYAETYGFSRERFKILSKKNKK